MIVECRMESGGHRVVPVYCLMGDIPLDLVLLALLIGLVWVSSVVDVVDDGILVMVYWCGMRNKEWRCLVRRRIIV